MKQKKKKNKFLHVLQHIVELQVWDRHNIISCRILDLYIYGIGKIC